MHRPVSRRPVDPLEAKIIKPRLHDVLCDEGAVVIAVVVVAVSVT